MVTGYKDKYHHPYTKMDFTTITTSHQQINIFHDSPRPLPPFHNSLATITYNYLQLLIITTPLHAVLLYAVLLYDFCLTTMITVYPSPTNITKCPMSTMILQDNWFSITKHCYNTIECRW